MTFRSIKERTFLADLTRAERRDGGAERPADVPGAGDLGEAGRRRRAAEAAAVHVPRVAGRGAGRGGRAVADQRDVVDDVPAAARTPFVDEAARSYVAARLAGMEHVLDTTDWRVAACVFFATDRIQHCLSQYLSSDHPAYVEAVEGRRSAEASATSTGSWTMGWARLVVDAARDDLVLFMSDHGMQSCTGAVNMDRLLAERWVPGVLGVEGDLRSDAVGSGPVGGAEGLRPAGAARQGLAPAVGELGEDTRLHGHPFDRRGR